MAPQVEENSSKSPAVDQIIENVLTESEEDSQERTLPVRHLQDDVTALRDGRRAHDVRARSRLRRTGQEHADEDVIAVWEGGNAVTTQARPTPQDQGHVGLGQRQEESSSQYVRVVQGLRGPLR